ncbi:MAG: hypothetical protein AB7O59_00805 [Pirellulales bacterium]
MDSQQPAPTTSVASPAAAESLGQRLVRALRTPLSDLLRGDLTGQTDARSEIVTAGLALPIGELILEVVRRARLWRSERLDVARELVAHFADGLDSGRTAEELVADFGDTRLAAQLIRQAKLRNRSWWWHSWRFAVRLTLASLLVAIVSYTVLVARFYWGRPVIAHNFSREINAARQVPKADRAWPIYEQAGTLLKKKPLKYEFDWDTAVRGSANWNKLVAMVDERAEALALARAAAKKPFLGAAVNAHGAENPELITVQLEYCQTLRELCHLLLADARVAAEAGQSERAYDDITATIAMADQLYQPRVTLVEQLVAIAVFSFAMNVNGRILAERPQLYSEQQLQDLAHRIAASRAGEPQLDLSVERMMFDDLLQRAYTDDGAGDGRVTSEGLRLFGEWTTRDLETVLRADRKLVPVMYLITPGVAALIGGRRENRELYESLIDGGVRAHQGPPWTWDAQEVNYVDNRVHEMASHPLGRMRYLPVVLLAPAIGGCYNAVERTIQYRDAAEVAIALSIWHQRHGAWPENLAQLVPALLPQVPADRLDGQPLRYAVRDGQPVVYSLGMDYDDDGGRGIDPEKYTPGSIGFGPPSPESLKLYRNAENDGDWILWPPLAKAEDGSAVHDDAPPADAPPIDAETEATGTGESQ